MSEQRELELLRAFASSKSYEFEGFKHRWLEMHPETAEPVSTEETVTDATQVYTDTPTETTEPTKTTRRKKTTE
jgi:hypothetical protein